jgi:hypothetical protein
MVGADIGAALAWAGLSAMLVTAWAPLWLMITVSALAGLATAMFFPAFTGAVPEVVAAQRLQSANGLLRLGMNGARIGGFAVAGGAVAQLGPGWAMALNAGLLLVSAAMVSLIRRPSVARPVALPAVAVAGGNVEPASGNVAPASGNVVRDLRDGWQEFRSRQWLWVVVLQYSFVMMVLQAVWGVLGPVAANQSLGGSTGWSWVLGAEAVGMIVGVTVAIRARPRHPVRLAVLLTFPLASVPLALGLGAPLPVAAGSAFVGGVALDIIVVMWDTTMQREIPAAALSRVSSYDALGTLMLGPVGLLVAGPSVGVVGVRPALLVSAAVIGLATLAALASPGVRTLRWSAPAEDLDAGAAVREASAILGGVEPAARSIAAIDHKGSATVVGAGG